MLGHVVFGFGQVLKLACARHALRVVGQSGGQISLMIVFDQLIGLVVALIMGHISDIDSERP